MDAWAAVIELGSVVVGILVALWVNNWNQRRLRKQEEAAYLDSLRDDVLTDVEALAQHIEFADGTAEAARSLIGMIRGAQPLADPPSVLRSLKRAGMIYPFQPTKTTFQELSGGGNLSIIGDRQILRALIRYYNATEMPREASALAIRRIWVEYYDTLSRSIDPALIPSITLDVFGLLREGAAASDSAPADRLLPTVVSGEKPFDASVILEAVELERSLAMVLDSSVLVRESLTDLRAHAADLENLLGRARL